MRDFIVIDTETGGLIPKEHSLLTVGVLFIKDGRRMFKGGWKIKHDKYSVTPGALKVNGINLVKHHEDAVTIEEFWNDFKFYYEDRFGTPAGVAANNPVVVGHNIGFDLGFIHENIGKSKWEEYANYRNVDTAGISKFLIDTGIIQAQRNSLDELISYFGIDDPNWERHTALWDAEATWEVYNAMSTLVSKMAPRKEYFRKDTILGGM